MNSKKNKKLTLIAMITLYSATSILATRTVTEKGDKGDNTKTKVKRVK